MLTFWGICVQLKCTMWCLRIVLILRNYWWVILKFWSIEDTTTSSHQRCFFKKGSKNFPKFTGKYLCQSLFFNKGAGLKHATLLKKILQWRCFPVDFLKFLRASFSQNTFEGYFCTHLLVSHGGSRDFENRMAFYVGHHGWPAKKILGFRRSKEDEITIETISFW